MSSTDAMEGVLAALQQYFSPPIARALLQSTMRRVRIDGPALPTSALSTVIAEFEKSLPRYIADDARRDECVRRLRRLVPSAAAVTSKSVPQAIRAAPARPLSSMSTVIQIATADDVANACEVGRDLALRIGFSHVDQTKFATAIAELTRNIILYAASGEARIAGIDTPQRGLEIIAADEGPGIRDLDLVMSVAYRSRTGMGLGLKGVKRIMDKVEITTTSSGTTVKAWKFLK